MKSRKKARRNLFIGRNAGDVAGKYNPEETPMGGVNIKPGTRYVQVDVDDVAELDRFVALNLTAEQAKDLGERLIAVAKIVAAATERDAEREREVVERNAYWEAMALRAKDRTLTP